MDRENYGCTNFGIITDHTKPAMKWKASAFEFRGCPFHSRLCVISDYCKSSCIPELFSIHARGIHIEFTFTLIKAISVLHLDREHIERHRKSRTSIRVFAGSPGFAVCTIDFIFSNFSPEFDNNRFTFYLKAATCIRTPNINCNIRIFF